MQPALIGHAEGVAEIQTREARGEHLLTQVDRGLRVRLGARADQGFADRLLAQAARNQLLFWSLNAVPAVLFAHARK